MAKTQRSNSSVTPISGDLNSNASILDAIDDGPELNLQDFIQSQMKEQNDQENESKKHEGALLKSTPAQFIPKEESLTILEQVAMPVKRQAVVLKSISQSTFRLGLESTPEKFKAMPGTTQRWAPKRVGNLYRTGLNRPELAPTQEEREKKIAELEYHFGKKLDNAFYADMSYRIDNNKPLGEKLYLDKPEDLVVYLAMLESDSVALGIHEYKNGKKPFAIWYIEDKEAEAESDAKERSDKIKASIEFNNLSTTKKKRIATILGLEIMGLSDGAAESVLWKWLDANKSDQNGVNAKKVSPVIEFMALIKRGDTYINISEMVQNALRFNILRKTATNDIFYGDTMIGTTAEQIVDKLMSTQYSDLRLGIQSKVEIKLNTV